MPHGAVLTLEQLRLCAQNSPNRQDFDGQYLTIGAIANADVSGINFISGARVERGQINGVNNVHYLNGNPDSTTVVPVSFSVEEVLSVLVPGARVVFAKGSGMLGILCASQ